MVFPQALRVVQSRCGYPLFAATMRNRKTFFLRQAAEQAHTGTRSAVACAKPRCATQRKGGVGRYWALRVAALNMFISDCGVTCPVSACTWKRLSRAGMYPCAAAAS